MERDPAALGPGVRRAAFLGERLWRRARLAAAPPQWPLRVCVLLAQLAGRLTTL